MIYRTFLKLGLGVIGTSAGTIALASNDLIPLDINSLSVVRVGRAAKTVGSIVFDYQFSLMNLEHNSNAYLEEKSKIHSRSAHKLLNLCSINGGAFVKVGQHVAALNYLVPAEYVSVLSVLHSGAPSSSLKDVQQVIREDLKDEVFNIFDNFEVEPIGAASLAQVHKATLKDGRVVAVKVQHKKVHANVLVDMKTMEFLVNVVAYIFPEFSLLWLAEETKRNLPQELDFIHEGRNAEKVKEMFSKFHWLKIPEIIWEYSTKRVLTMEFCNGCDVKDKEYMLQNGIRPSEISRNLGQLYSEMIFVRGYVHCDPHPGNILVQKQVTGAKIVLLDHGLYTILTDKFRVQYSQMWMALIRADIKGIREVGKELGVGDLYGLLACMMSARSWSAVTEGIQTERSSSEQEQIKEFVSKHLSEVTQILSRVPREMLLIFKTNDLLRGIETSLGTRGAASSFVIMSKCCTQSVYNQRISECNNWMCRTKYICQKKLVLMKINFFQLFNWFKEFFLSFRILPVFFS